MPARRSASPSRRARRGVVLAERDEPEPVASPAGRRLRRGPRPGAPGSGPWPRGAALPARAARRGGTARSPGSRAAAGGAGSRGRCRSPRPGRLAPRLAASRDEEERGRDEGIPRATRPSAGARPPPPGRCRRAPGTRARGPARICGRSSGRGFGRLGLEEALDGLVGRVALERDPARLHERVAPEGMGDRRRGGEPVQEIERRRSRSPSRASATPRQNGISVRIAPGAPLWTISSQRAIASAGRSCRSRATPSR